jgi:preprotein translocase subunit YajC
MMFGSIAFAMGQKGAGGSSGLVGLVPLVQQKQVKRHQEFIKNLKKGDRVVTTGGLHGSITGITDTVVTLDIADNVRVKVSRSAVAGLSKDQTSTQQQ